MVEILQTLIVSAIPAIIAGLTSYYGSKKKAESEIKTLQIQNKNELDRLVEQHKINLESLTAAHNLEIEKSDCEHKHQLEIIKLNHQNELQRKSKELEDTAKFQATSNLTSELIPQLFTMFMETPEIRKEFETKFKQSLNEK